MKQSLFCLFTLFTLVVACAKDESAAKLKGYWTATQTSVSGQPAQNMEEGKAMLEFQESKMRDFSSNKWSEYREYSVEGDSLVAKGAGNSPRMKFRLEGADGLILSVDAEGVKGEARLKRISEQKANEYASKAAAPKD